MTYRILCLLLGAATASAWWAFAVFEHLRNFQDNGFVVPVVLLTLGCAVILFLESEKAIRK